MVTSEVSYHPRPGNRISAIGANLTDSGMLQICMAVYDSREDLQGNRPSREYSLEIWPDKLLPPDLRGSLQELSLEGVEAVVWKRGERSCSEWNRGKKESVETGWQKILSHRLARGKRYSLTEQQARSGDAWPPEPPKRAVLYRVEAAEGAATLLFVGRPTTTSPERQILLTLDGRHIADVF